MHHPGAFELTVLAVTGDVRGGEGAEAGQRGGEGRLGFPDVEHGGCLGVCDEPFRQGCVIDDRPTCGVDDNGGRLDGREIGAIEQVKGGIDPATMEGDVKGDDIGFGE